MKYQLIIYYLDFTINFLRLQPVHNLLCILAFSRKVFQNIEKMHPTKVRCASWIQRHVGVLTGQKENRVQSAENKNREPHKNEIRDLEAAACRWLY